MNLALVDPFVLAQDCPEAMTGKLRSGHSSCIRFNHRGDYLASGRAEGTVVVFDIETNGVARKMRGHTRQIQSLSWSSNDRYLLSASQDCKCILWDLEDGTRIRSVRFEAPIFIAEIHPTNHLMFITALFEQQPVLVDVTDEIPKKCTLPSVPKRSQAEWEKLSTRQQTLDEKQTTTVAVWSSSGEHVLAGTSRGWLNVIDTRSRQIVHSTHLSSNLIVFIRLTASGRDMVINSSDRIIRTVHLPDFTDPKTDFDNLRIEVEHKFQDLVNRLSWNHVCFSATGDYVTASTYMNHDVYIWERRHGSLVKILEGPKEELSVVEWHPHRPFVAAVGAESGPIFIWSLLTPQRWSALAPDFHEVEENVEYVEREDEFDIQPLEELHKRRLDQEDEEVDVLTIDPGKADFNPGEFRMPVLLDLDASDSEDEVIAIGTGQYRRKSPGRGQQWMNEAEAVENADDTAGGRKAAINGISKAPNGTKRRRAD
ncbi:WD40 repeat-like protein [Pseudovirgaria hyperparasitica]|uniref:WD40 repeat-like protein n=1 Tax=Pseudovirgaria hyperparasitica TaxID=470096 RepID=A0A6A6WC34_9PEZI|nr:WD40 repeat-like protein [Pseudovirgaria hyperparasitica]KAF2758671.1 WD40 repeat-like protein [Pseudovirgaria hyperparasitica]